MLPESQMPERAEVRVEAPPVLRIAFTEVPNEVVAGAREPCGRHVHIEFSAPKMIGSGTFGNVFVARMALTGELIAIKKVKREMHFKSRELGMLRIMDHPNIIHFKYFFRTLNDLNEEHIYYVTEYMPKSLYQLICGYRRTFQNIPRFLVKLYAFQICRALTYLHRQDICHRDLKTQNVLVDPATNIIKLCDFGSAKRLNANEPNVAYICSRYYRAPELLIGYTQYTTAIDIWSFGIVLIEMITGTTPFNGSTESSQLDAIVQVLGTPSPKIVTAMKKSPKDYCIPERSARRLKDVFPSIIPPNGIKLLKQILIYEWNQRPTAIEICANEYFDELRVEKASVMRNIPPIFNWTPADIDGRPDLRSRIFPRYVLHARPSSSQA